MRNKQTKLTAKIARQLLTYNPKTGALIWKHRPRSWFNDDATYARWNGHHALMPAFTALCQSGCRQGTILGENHLASRMIWLLMTGKWPKGKIRQRNGDQRDYRWKNLGEERKSPLAGKGQGRSISSPL